eukprot:m.162726 g.162726  ORF g.162726 m.162726 type:complete len:329 (+) comp23883_c0_seq2:132-1118(+)
MQLARCKRYLSLLPEGSCVEWQGVDLEQPTGVGGGRNRQFVGRHSQQLRQLCEYPWERRRNVWRRLLRIFGFGRATALEPHVRRVCLDDDSVERHDHVAGLKRGPKCGRTFSVEEKASEPDVATKVEVPLQVGRSPGEAVHENGWELGLPGHQFGFDRVERQPFVQKHWLLQLARQVQLCREPRQLVLGRWEAVGVVESTLAHGDALGSAAKLGQALQLGRGRPGVAVERVHPRRPEADPPLGHRELESCGRLVEGRAWGHELGDPDRLCPGNQLVEVGDEVWVQQVCVAVDEHRHRRGRGRRLRLGRSMLSPIASLLRHGTTSGADR